MMGILAAGVRAVAGGFILGAIGHQVNRMEKKGAEEKPGFKAIVRAGGQGAGLAGILFGSMLLSFDTLAAIFEHMDGRIH